MQVTGAEKLFGEIVEGDLVVRDHPLNTRGPDVLHPVDGPIEPALKHAGTFMEKVARWLLGTVARQLVQVRRRNY